MKDFTFNSVLTIVAAIIIGIAGFFYYVSSKPTDMSKLELSVPYASQAPYGEWKEPWDEACEETSAVMIDAYYKNVERLETEGVKKTVQNMIDWEKSQQLPTEDTNAEQTVQLINSTTDFEAEIKTNPTVEEIKEELTSNRPVIALINMYEFYQEASQGDSYHVLVITGYDDKKGVFIVNDPARSKKEYRYDILLKALHDFNPESKEADGPPTILFTKP